MKKIFVTFFLALASSVLFKAYAQTEMFLQAQPVVSPSPISQQCAFTFTIVVMNLNEIDNSKNYWDFECDLLDNQGNFLQEIDRKCDLYVAYGATVTITFSSDTPLSKYPAGNYELEASAALHSCASCASSNICYTGVDSNGVNGYHMPFKVKIASGCSGSPEFSISSNTISAPGGIDSVATDQSNGCTCGYTYQSSVPWITFTNNVDTIPGDTINYIVASNVTCSARTGYIYLYQNGVIKSTFTVNQQALGVVATPDSIFGATSVCQNSKQTYYVSPVFGATSYTWTLPSGWIGTSVTDSISNVLIGTNNGSISVIANGPCGNSSAKTLSVKVNAAPTFAITPNSPSFCIGNNVQLYAIGNATVYTWMPSSSLSASVGSSVTASPTVSVKYYAIGVANGCSTTDSVFVTVNPLPDVSVSGLNSAYCVNASAVSLKGGSPSGGSYSGIGVSSGEFNPTLAGVGGPYTITYSYTDNNSCTDTATEQVSVNALPNVSLSGLNSAYCVNASVVNLTGGTPLGGIYSGTGVSNGEFNPELAGVGGPYTITYSYTDNNSCTNTATEQVSVNSLPVVTVAPDTITLCAGTTTTLNASGALNYTWSPALGLNATTGSRVTAQPTISSTYTVVGVDNNNCSSTSMSSITIDVPPTLTISRDTTITTGNKVTLTASSTGTVTWSPSDSLSCTVCNNPLAAPTLTTTYYATAVKGQCSVVDSVVITVTSATGINQNQASVGWFSIYPNPSTGAFVINGNTDITKITIANILGQEVYEMLPNESHFSFEIKDNGMYFATITSNHETTTVKVVVNR